MTDYFDAVTETKGLILIAGSFKPNGASAVDNTANNPLGLFTAARTGTGVFTVTLTNPVNKIHAVFSKLRKATADNVQMALNSYVDTTGVITITALDSTASTAGNEAVTDALANFGTRMDNTAAHLSDVATHLSASETADAGADLAEAVTDLQSGMTDFDTGIAAMVTQNAALLPSAADVAAAAGTMIEVFIVAENSSVYRAHD